MDDATLLARYSDHHDAEAFAEILNRHSGLVYGTCLRVLGDRHRAEDAAQDCFLALAEHAGSIRQSLTAWLHRVALHAALKLRRRDRPAPEVDVENLPAPLASTWRTIAPQLDAALEALPEDLRAIITSRYLAGRSQMEIGQQLGVSQATISRRLEQGVTLLRNRLARQFDDHAIETAMSLALVQAPASMIAACGRIGLAGLGGSASAVKCGLTFTAKVAVATLLIGGGAAMALTWTNRSQSPRSPGVVSHPSIALAATAQAENPPAPAPASAPPAPAPAASAGTALCAQLVTINVQGWPIARVVDTLSDQLQLDHARLELAPCPDDQTLVDLTADAKPLGMVLDQLVHQCGWQVQIGSQAVVLYRPAPVTPSLQTRASLIQQLIAARVAQRPALAESMVRRGDLQEITALIAGLASPEFISLSNTDPAQALALQAVVLHAVSQVGASWQSWIPRGNPLANLRDDMPACRGVVASWMRCRQGKTSIPPFLIYLAGELGVTEIGGDMLLVVTDPATVLPGIDHQHGVMHAMLDTVERKWALHALGRMGYAPGLLALRGRLTAEPMDPARLATLAALGECGSAADATLVTAFPMAGDWMLGATVYTAMARLAPASLPDLLKRGGPVRWGETDAFITYPCADTLPRALESAGADGWWRRWAGWKGTGRMPAADVDAAIHALTGPHGQATPELLAILARDGDDAALDRLIQDIVRQPEILGDHLARAVELIPLELMARLPAARQQRALAQLRAHLDLAHAGDACLSMLRVDSNPALATELIAAWPASDDQGRPALLRALAQLRQPAARTFIIDTLKSNPSQAVAQALELGDLADAPLRTQLAALLVSDPTTGPNAIGSGLACYDDTLAAVQAFVALHAGSFDHPAVQRLLTNLPPLREDLDPGLIDVLLALLAQSPDAGARHDLIDALTDGCARRAGPERLRVVAALVKACADANPAVASFALKSRNRLAAPDASQGEDLYGEHAVMTGGLDDLTSAAAFDALVATGFPQPAADTPAAPAPPAHPPTKDF